MQTLNESAKSGTDQEWKTRYRDLARELDHDRATWAQSERALVQALLKFAQCFDGEDPALDRQLSALRGNLRGSSDPKARASLLQEVGEACAAAARRRGSAGEAGKAPLEQLFAALKIPPHAAFEFKQLQSRLKSGEDPARLAGLLAGALNDLASAALSRTDSVRAAGVAEDLIPRVLEELAPRVPGDRVADLRNAWQSDTGVAARQAQGIKLLQLLREALTAPTPVAAAAPAAPEPPGGSLLQLLDWLLLPAEFEERSRKLRDTLGRGSPVDPVRETGSFLNDLHAFLRRDLRTLEEYLKQASANLTEIDTALRDAVDHSRMTAADSSELTRGINAEMDEIDAAVHGEQPAADLRALVERRVATIRATMSTYVNMQSSKQEAYERRIADLTQRVQNFELESSRLRRNLEVEHARAHRDTLTNAPNRLAYEERALLEIKRARRNASPLTLAVIDLDRFKSINDNFGHKAGDKLLRYTASIALKRVRATDLFARYGGEEFVALFPDTELAAAFEVCEDLRRQIAASSFHYKGSPVSVSVSIGLAQLGEQDTLNDLFEHADRALYRAKHAGRNRTERAG